MEENKEPTNQEEKIQEDEIQEEELPEGAKICPFYSDVCNEEDCPLWGTLTAPDGNKLNACCFTLIGIILLQLSKAMFQTSSGIDLSQLSKIIQNPRG